MKSISLKLGNKTIALALPGSGLGLNKTQKFLVYLDLFQTFFFYVLLFLTPLSIIIFRNNSFETSSFSLTGYLLLIIYGIYLASLILQAKYRITDSSSIFNILIFALLTTLSAVLIIPADTANTFGTVGIVAHKGLAGLAIISYIAVYYLVTINIHKESHIAKIFKYLSLGFITYVVLAFLDNNLITANYFQILLIIIFLSLQTLLINKKYFLYFLPILFIGISLLFKFEFEIEDLFIILFTSLIASLLIYIVLFAKYRDRILDWINIILNSLSDIYVEKDGKNSLNIEAIYAILNSIKNLLLILLLPIILIILFILTATNSKVISNIFESGFNSISNAIDAINGSSQKIISGLGTSKASNLSLYPTLFSQIVVGHGLLGVLAYGFLFIYTIVYTFRLLASNIFQNRSYLFKVTAILSFFIVFIPLLGFFIYPSHYLLFIWWIFIGIILSINPLLKLNQTKVNFSEMYSIRFIKLGKLNGSKNLSLILSILLLVIFIAFAFLFLNIKGDIV